MPNSALPTTVSSRMAVQFSSYQILDIWHITTKNTFLVHHIISHCDLSSEELHHLCMQLNPSITKGLKYEILAATGKSGAPSKHPQSSMHLTPLNSE